MWPSQNLRTLQIMMFHEYQGIYLFFFQIYQQFPFSFEFTEKFLIMLADHSYSSNFGTFLCDSDYERNIMNVQKHTVSLWSYINQPNVLPNYLNCLYDPNAKVIWPSVAPISLVSAYNFWTIVNILYRDKIKNVSLWIESMDYTKSMYDQPHF